MKLERRRRESVSVGKKKKKKKPGEGESSYPGEGSALLSKTNGWEGAEVLSEA